MNAIKSRMKSVRSTRQITKAMELVSSSKLRRAKEKALSVVPYHEEIISTLRSLKKLKAECESDFLASREIKRTCYIVLSGDRGLAGGYNNNIYKLVESVKTGTDDIILPIGKKSIEYYARKKAEIIDPGYETLDSVGCGGASDISSLICREYLAGKIDRVCIVYTKFISMLTQTPVCEQILPLEINDDSDNKNGSASQALCDSSPSELINSLIPFCVSGMIYTSLMQAIASEHGARRNAMSAATKNAGEILDNLQISFNRARQAAITQEITEIVSGAEAL